jgi:hypothetical protein
MNARDKHAEKIKAYNESRPRITITTKMGTDFILRKLDAVEVVKVFDILGVSMDEIATSKSEVLGAKMLAHLDEILDKVVRPMSVSPRLMPSGTVATGEDDLSVDDLEAIEKSELIQKLVDASQGAEGKALGESFRPDASRQTGGPDVR